MALCNLELQPANRDSEARKSPLILCSSLQACVILSGSALSFYLSGRIVC